MEVRDIKKNLNEQLIKAIKEVLPPDKSLPNLLMEMLFVSKDAVYRRIRGDVSFTLEELSILSEKLNLSLDNVLGLTNKENAVFNLKTFRIPSGMEDYSGIIKEYTHTFEELNQCPLSKLSMACDSIPQILYLNYSYLTKFRLYKWVFQSSIEKKVIPFSDIHINRDFSNTVNNYIESSSKINHIELILGQHTFVSFAREVAYFKKIELTTAEEIEKIKKELLDLLIVVESIAATGRHPVWKQDITIYLSNANIKTSYCCAECKSFTSSNFMVYPGNMIGTQNDRICDIQKEWMETMKRFSTLITNSGEIYRRTFFSNQRRLIEEIL